MNSLEVTILGSGSPIPDPNRAGPSTLLRAGGRTLLVDCGRGVLMRLAAAGLGAAQLDALLVTHLHSDHITDLGDLITTRWITSFTPNPLVAHGPEGLDEVVSATVDSLERDISYRLAHHADLTWRPDPIVHTHPMAATPVVIDAAPGVRVTASPTAHHPASPSIAYRIDHDGRSAVVAGDTLPCDGLDALCDGADVLVHTVIRDDLIRAVPIQRLVDVCDYHSTVSQAARSAARGGVRTLVLTHCVPAVREGAQGEWVRLAEEHFDGVVIVAEDLTTVTVGSDGG